MTDNALKAVALEAMTEIRDGLLNDVLLNNKPKKDGWGVDIILRRIQPLIDADRQETERLKKALRFYADDENYNGDCALGNRDKQGQWEYDLGCTARTALGEERPCKP